MPALAGAAAMLADACTADDREAAEKFAFELDLALSKLGHMPPDVFEITLDLLAKLDPRSSSTYVLLVNLLRLKWSTMTAYQRKQVLDVLAPHTKQLEFFEAQQAILEIFGGKYLG